MKPHEYRSLWRLIDRSTDLRSSQKMRRKQHDILMSAAAGVLRPEDMRVLSERLRLIVSATNDYDVCRHRLRIDDLLRGRVEW